MVERTNDGDEDVALESCEFWAAFCEADLEQETVEVLREFCPKLIPMLLTNMAYQDDDEAGGLLSTSTRPTFNRPTASARL
jgi:transportin-1